jgi:hypothetical protein
MQTLPEDYVQFSRTHLEQRSWQDPPSFQELMAEQLEHAPWLGLSILAHALVIALLFTIKIEPPFRAEAVALLSQPESTVEEIVEDPPEEILEDQLEEMTEPQLLDALEEETPVDEDVEITDLESDPNPDPTPREHSLEPIAGIGGGGPTGSGRRISRGIGTRNPPGRQTIQAIERGLEWLARHQDEDGKWSASEFSKHCPAGHVCSGPGNAVHDVGVTGLAMLAFLGDGHTPRSGHYRDNVKRATLWLRSQQDEDGLFGPENGHGYMYGHAIASLAMVEAYGLSRYTVLRRNAQRAIDYIQRARNPYKVWRYYPQDGQNDTSVTGWMVFALKSAKEFGLHVDRDALQCSLAWFDEVTDPSTGQAGYSKRGEPSSRKAGLQDRFPSDKTEAMTAVGALCRIFLGQTPEEYPVLDAAADTMLRKPPVWNAADGSIDFYYWYYASYAMFQIGGQRWKQWRRSLSAALVQTQETEGHAAGSWAPISAWGEDGGRVYTTALGVLCLEVYYRYTRLLR